MNPAQQEIFDALLHELIPYAFLATYTLIYGGDAPIARVTIEGHGIHPKEILILPSGQIL